MALRCGCDGENARGKPPEADKLVGSKLQLLYSVQEAANMPVIN